MHAKALDFSGVVVREIAMIYAFLLITNSVLYIQKFKKMNKISAHYIIYQKYYLFVVVLWTTVKPTN